MRYSILVLLLSLACITQLCTAALSQNKRSRLETRLRSLERRVANLEAAQTGTATVPISSPATITGGPRTTQEIERINIQAVSPRSNLPDQGTVGATGAGATTTSAA